MQLPTRKKELERLQNQEVDLYVTPEKFNRMERELERLLKTERAAAVAEVIRTGEMGDFSENAGYQIAKGNLRRINRRILLLEDRIARAVIIQKDDQNDRVRIGSTVTMTANNTTFTYQILGSQESNPMRGKISHSSPIGKALLGAKVGETVLVKLPQGTVPYTVISIL